MGRDPELVPTRPKEEVPVSRRTVCKDKLTERSFEPIDRDEYRDIVDLKLQGLSAKEIARQTERTVRAVKKILWNVCHNYAGDENISRTPAIERLGNSILDPDRQPNVSDGLLFVNAHKAGRSEAEIMVILNLTREGVQALSKKYVKPKRVRKPLF